MCGRAVFDRPVGAQRGVMGTFTGGFRGLRPLRPRLLTPAPAGLCPAVGSMRGVAARPRTGRSIRAATATIRAATATVRAATATVRAVTATVRAATATVRAATATVRAATRGERSPRLLTTPLQGRRGHAASGAGEAMPQSWPGGPSPIPSRPGHDPGSVAASARRDTSIAHQCAGGTSRWPRRRSGPCLVTPECL